MFFALHPALKRGAKVARPFGAGYSCISFCRDARKRVLAHTLKALRRPQSNRNPALFAACSHAQTESTGPSTIKRNPALFAACSHAQTESAGPIHNQTEIQLFSQPVHTHRLKARGRPQSNANPALFAACSHAQTESAGPSTIKRNPALFAACSHAQTESTGPSTIKRQSSSFRSLFARTFSRMFYGPASMKTGFCGGFWLLGGIGLRALVGALALSA